MREGTGTKEHQRTWHNDCYTIFALDSRISKRFLWIEQEEEDTADYDTGIKSKTKTTRKILPGNSTYLFFDSDTDKASSSSFSTGMGNALDSSLEAERDKMDGKYSSMQVSEAFLFQYRTENTTYYR